MAVDQLMSPTEAAAYAEKLQAVVEDFSALGHGSRLQASLDIGVSSSRVTGVLKFRGVDEKILDQLAMWAAEQRQLRGI